MKGYRLTKGFERVLVTTILALFIFMYFSSFNLGDTYNLSLKNGTNKKEIEISEVESKTDLTSKDNNIHNGIFYKSKSSNIGMKIALTFDDGVDDYFTYKILDILRENDVKATFFVLGVHVNKHPEALLSVYQDGHQIANHSYSHKNMMYLSNEDITNEIISTQEEIYKVTGDTSNYFRPPYGNLTVDQIEFINNELNYNIVYWSVGTMDWNSKFKKRYLSSLLLK
jgi:peptidoglycan/xylan/chitin deacetylase (PgdA/CDA1 family)